MRFSLPRGAISDAFTLRKDSLPDFRRTEIIAFHATEIECQADSDKKNHVWRDGQLSPKALLAAGYINSMFLKAHKGKQVVTPEAVDEVHWHHIRMVRSGEILFTNPLGYTALSALAYATDVIRKTPDERGMAAYVCEPSVQDWVDLAS